MNIIFFHFHAKHKVITFAAIFCSSRQQHITQPNADPAGQEHELGTIGDPACQGNELGTIDIAILVITQTQTFHRQ
jgi:hypothetical protein